jgi:hypothetical protein
MRSFLYPEKAVLQDSCLVCQRICLFAYGVFNDAVNSSGYASQRKISMISEQ